MEVPTILSKGEEELLTCVGYLVMRWNYAEWCARQILRRYVSGDSINDPGHLRLSARQARWIEDELRVEVLPLWQGTGRAHLECLVQAYAVAREHRNHLVHGIYQTVGTGAERPAKAVLFPSMPKNGRAQAPTFVAIADIRPVADHFFDLGEFAQKVMVGFDVRGDRALNSDGTLVLQQLPGLIAPLPPCRYETV
jgi:hypothetical protein